MTMKLEFPEPLPEKYRPERVRDFIGIPAIKRIFENFIKNPFPSYWFFVGGSGLGKTALVQAVGKEINAQIEEIPSAECDLERVRAAAARCRYGAFNFETGEPCIWHILAIHEANRMTPAAQDSFLSKMDSTAAPPQTIIIFTANNTSNLSDAFLSRCNLQEFEADSMKDELPGYLQRIYKKEGGKHPLDFQAIAKASQYNVRDALNKIQVELLLGANRKGLPTKELKINPEHTHFCKGKCKKEWKHADPNCDLPYRSVCPQCGGAKTAGSLRAQKAWVTIRANIAKEIKSKKKKRA